MFTGENCKKMIIIQNFFENKKITKHLEIEYIIMNYKK